MAQVTVTIDGKAYRMACEEGQENHLTDLASQFDRYVSHLKSQFGEIGDLRVTVMAGIMVMDELSELKRRISAAEATSAGAIGREDDILAAIMELTERLNGLTRKLTEKPQAAAAAPDGHHH
ncbi:cell division protein ZapA [Agrobacterium vitis]|uniref:Cell division protein ZapA n=1 Tax=Agrobacterium vitis TaxID=373 RepID=A0A109CS95_AGRVI|nr:cell division protein ZapA [Agrobacterium vitis]KAA3517567.1 cell division protein ZapA [Agrobacterium vitis]KAA3526968.1 cell division protein ZapA [Agrobacterium vitis]MCF1466404.1 cell division protein ZapA [Agrobacterium vitis]MCF1477008.1 cell division protein ZapA [Agrobacterium vitis]MCM2453265.1 cell division protein ZapA [Agrobacterium vitis]